MLCAYVMLRMLCMCDCCVSVCVCALSYASMYVMCGMYKGYVMYVCYVMCTFSVVHVCIISFVCVLCYVFMCGMFWVDYGCVYVMFLCAVYVLLCMYAMYVRRAMRVCEVCTNVRDVMYAMPCAYVHNVCI